MLWIKHILEDKMINVSEFRDQEVRPVFVQEVEITFKEAAYVYLKEAP